MATFCFLQEILEKQCDKLKDLETATTLINSKKAINEDLLRMYKQVEDTRDGIETMRRSLNEMKRQNDKCVELLSLLEKLDKKIVHMEKNVSSELISDYQNSENSLRVSILPAEEFIKRSLTITESDAEERCASLKDCKKVLFNEPEVYPIVPLIGEDEFKTIPKYIIGRQSIEIVNNLIDTINQVLKAKYTYLSQGKAHARKQGSMNLYLYYKKQELEVCTDREYVHFFTGGDYEKYTNAKLSKVKLNLLTVLRHCKRLREYRVKSDIYYVVQSKTND